MKTRQIEVLRGSLHCEAFDVQLTLKANHKAVTAKNSAIKLATQFYLKKKPRLPLTRHRTM